MNSPHATLDDLAEPLREPVARYVERLQTICGSDLLAVTFYGPLKAPLPGESAALANTAVFRTVDLELLARIARDGKRFGRSGIAAPWALTPQLIDESRDSFPLELWEIAQQHVCVYGQDYFADLVFEPAHVRLQCERELKVVEIHLQRGLLAAAGDERALGRLGRHLAHTLLRVLGGLAWLGGDREPRAIYDLVEKTEQSIGRELVGIRRLLDDSLAASWEEFAQLHADVQMLRETVDGMS
jgi:hypothetical protein